MAPRSIAAAASLTLIVCMQAVQVSPVVAAAAGAEFDPTSPSSPSAAASSAIHPALCLSGWQSRPHIRRLLRTNTFSCVISIASISVVLSTMALAHVRRQPHLVKLMWGIRVADCTVTIGAIWHLIHKEEDSGNNHANAAAAAAAAAVGNNAVTAGDKDVGAAAPQGGGGAAAPRQCRLAARMTVSRSTPPVAGALGGGSHIPSAACCCGLCRCQSLPPPISLRPRLHHCHRLQ